MPSAMRPATFCMGLLLASTAACGEGSVPDASRELQQASTSLSLSLSENALPPGQTLGYEAFGFAPNERVGVSLDALSLPDVFADGAGHISSSIVVPGTLVPGSHTLTLGAASGSVMQAFLVRTDWAQYRFNSARAGYNPYENSLTRASVGRLALLWRRHLQAVLSHAAGPSLVEDALIAASGRVYVRLGNGMLSAYKASTGVQEWSSTPLPIGSGAAAAYGLVYASSDDGTVTALEAGTGSVRWTASGAPGGIGTVAVKDGCFTCRKRSAAFRLSTRARVRRAGPLTSVRSVQRARQPLATACWSPAPRTACSARSTCRPGPRFFSERERPSPPRPPCAGITSTSLRHSRASNPSRKATARSSRAMRRLRR